jgi:hypothetical protein
LKGLYQLLAVHQTVQINPLCLAPPCIYYPLYSQYSQVEFAMVHEEQQARQSANKDERD